MDVHVVIIYTDCVCSVWYISYIAWKSQLLVLAICGLFLPPQGVERVLGTVSTLFLYIGLSVFLLFCQWRETSWRFLNLKITMEKKMNNEELQSRREFFKRAAKAALPVVGAVVLSNVPFQQIHGTTLGCDYCSHSCEGFCDSHCRNSCSINCTGTCWLGCDGTCKNSCEGCGFGCGYSPTSKFDSEF